MLSPRLSASLRAILFVLLALAGCAKSNSRNSVRPDASVRKQTLPAPQHASASSASPGLPPQDPQLAPLVGFPWMLDLGEDKRLKDAVTPPLGARERRPVVVAVHGAGDRPNWACGGWRIGMDSYAFVLCPMGLPMSSETFGWSNTQSIQSAIDRSLNELRTAFGQYLHEGPMVYAGFSQGAELAGQFLVLNAQRFPVAALAEGGYSYLNDAKFAHAYRQAGGQRVLLVCGTPHCFVSATRAKTVLEKAGLLAIISGDPHSGHNLNVRMQSALRRDWAKLVDGVSGWETFGAHRWLTP